MSDIVCFGEMLIDFVAMERDTSVGYADSFEKAAGGAPANVAVGLSRLGISAAFMTQLGEDPFGQYLLEVLQNNQIDTTGVVFTDRAMTSLAFVSVEASGERSFAFYRKPGAEMLMQSDDLNIELLQQAVIFHYGSISLIDEPLRSTTQRAITLAHQSNALISYDPNLRLALWPSPQVARNGILAGLKLANLVKMNVEELAFLVEESLSADENTLVKASRTLWHDDLQLLVITLGAEGALAVTPDKFWRVEAFPVKVEDTIGAGDGFMAGLLSGLLTTVQDGQIKIKDDETIKDILRQACATGALTASKRGGIPALPYREELTTFLNFPEVAR